MNPVTFNDLKKAIDDVVTSEGLYETTVAADDAAHSALMAAGATANQTAQDKATAKADLTAKLDTLVAMAQGFEQTTGASAAAA